MKFGNKSLGAAILSLFLALPGTPPATSQKRPNGARNWDYTLNIVFEGPVGVVKYKDGQVVVFVADVEPHDYAFVNGLSDCELGGYNYAFNLPASVFDTTPDPNLNNNLNIPWTSALQIDPVGLHYASFSLPQPYQIKAAHVDPTAVSEKPFSSGVEPPYSDYQTSIVLRYKMDAADPSITISKLDPGGSNPCNGTSPNPVLTPQFFDKEHFLKVGVGPDVEDKDHTHAKRAFKAEVAMFPALKRYAKFPMPTRFRATDCRAPAILITDAP